MTVQAEPHLCCHLQLCWYTGWPCLTVANITLIRNWFGCNWSDFHTRCDILNFTYIRQRVAVWMKSAVRITVTLSGALILIVKQWFCHTLIDRLSDFSRVPFVCRVLFIVCLVWCHILLLCESSVALLACLDSYIMAQYLRHTYVSTLNIIDKPVTKVMGEGEFQSLNYSRKVKFSHTRYWALGPSWARRWLSHPRGGRLPLLSVGPAVTSVAFTRWQHISNSRSLLIYHPRKDERLLAWLADL